MDKYKKKLLIQLNSSEYFYNFNYFLKITIVPNKKINIDVEG